MCWVERLGRAGWLSAIRRGCFSGIRCVVPAAVAVLEQTKNVDVMNTLARRCRMAGGSVW